MCYNTTKIKQTATNHAHMLRDTLYIWRLQGQKQVSRAWISNHILQYSVGCNYCSKSWIMFLVPKSPYWLTHMGRKYLPIIACPTYPSIAIQQQPLRAALIANKGPATRIRSSHRWRPLQCPRRIPTADGGLWAAGWRSLLRLTVGCTMTYSSEVRTHQLGPRRHYATAQLIKRICLLRWCNYELLHTGIYHITDMAVCAIYSNLIVANCTSLYRWFLFFVREKICLASGTDLRIRSERVLLPLANDLSRHALCTVLSPGLARINTGFSCPQKTAGHGIIYFWYIAVQCNTPLHTQPEKYKCRMSAGCFISF